MSVEQERVRPVDRLLEVEVEVAEPGVTMAIETYGPPVVDPRQTS